MVRAQGWPRSYHPTSGFRSLLSRCHHQEDTVTYELVVISLPIADGRTSFDFYCQALSLEVK